jgi:hypothetical protein
MQVRCSNWNHCPQKREFGKFFCKHYEPHEPIILTSGTCVEVDSACLYYTGRCVPDETEKIKATDITVEKIEIPQYEPIPA